MEKMTTRCLHITMTLVLYKQKLSLLHPVGPDLAKFRHFGKNL